MLPSFDFIHNRRRLESQTKIVLLCRVVASRSRLVAEPSALPQYKWTGRFTSILGHVLACQIVCLVFYLIITGEIGLIV